MKFNLILFLLSLATVICTSCSSVTMKSPLNVSPKPVDQHKFEGIWSVGKGVIHINFAHGGIAKVAWLDWEKDEFKMGKGEMFVSETDELNFVCARLKDDDEWTDGYFFAQYKFTKEGDLVLWLANVKLFAEAIKKNDLKGEIKQSGFSKQVSITSKPKELLKFIKNSDDAMIFYYKDPMICRKILKSNEAEQGGADQPATAPESKSEGKEKTQPESERRPQ